MNPDKQNPQGNNNEHGDPQIETKETILNSEMVRMVKEILKGEAVRDHLMAVNAFLSPLEDKIKTGLISYEDVGTTEEEYQTMYNQELGSLFRPYIGSIRRIREANHPGQNAYIKKQIERGRLAWDDLNITEEEFNELTKKLI